MHLKFLSKFSVSVLNQEQIFEKLRRKNIEIFDIKRQDYNQTTFLVKTKQKALVEKVLSEYSANILCVCPKSLSRASAWLVAKWAVVVAIILCMSLYFASSFFVFKFEIYGTNILKNQQVIDVLKNEGALPICGKTKIDTAKLETTLLEKLPEISMASVAIRGLTLVVNVKEKNSLEAPQPQNLVATFAGRIKSLTVISGTAKVKINDVVQEGDVLVEGQQNAPAKASIDAEVWTQEQYVHYNTKTVKKRSGKQVSAREILFLGLPIFSSCQSPNFANFEEESTLLSISNLILPLKIKLTNYFELTDVVITEPYLEAKERIVAECKQNALQKIGKDDIIQNESVFETFGAGVTYVTYVLTTEKHIS